MEIINSSAFREFYAAFVVYHTAIIFGIDTSFTSFYLRGRDDATLTDESLLGSINIYARFFGALGIMMLVDRSGRKRSLMVMLITEIIGWWFIAYSQSKTGLYVGRILSGLATGAVTTSIVYTSEICHKERRGMLVACQLTAVSLGMSLPMIVIYFYDWEAMAKFTFFVAISGLIQLFHIPESHYWYMLKGEREKARQSLFWFWKSSTPADIDTELQNIEQSFVARNFSKSGFFDILLEKHNLKAFLVVFLIFTLQSGIGRIPIITHTEHFFIALHTPFDSKKVVLVLGFVDFIGCCFFSMLIDRFKRRTFIYMDIAILSFCLVGITFYDFVLQNLFIGQYLSALPIILMYTYLVVCLTGLVAGTRVLSTEMITHEHRGTVLSLATAVLQLVWATYSYLFPYALELVNIHAIFLYFLINLISIAIVIRSFVPETSGKALYEYVEELADDEQTEKLLLVK